MASESIRVTTVIPASAARIYRAWLSAREHSAFTGSKATVTPKPGGRFTAWDGYIAGKNIELEPERTIVQSWRTTEFPPESPDSRLEVVFDPASGGTRVTIIHTEIPPGQGERYRSGWVKKYFEPMQRYFAPHAEVAATSALSREKAEPDDSLGSATSARRGRERIPRAAAAGVFEGRESVAPRGVTRAAGASRLAKDKYDAVAKAILAVVPRKGDGILVKDLPKAVAARVPKTLFENGSVSRYTTAVKRDLEARGVIERVAGSKPERFVRKK
jgi:uncharacterized protein YndB with AHSA1/START domain